MAKIKTREQIERKIKSYCKDVNNLNKEFFESDDEAVRGFLSRSIDRNLSVLRALKWVSGINYDKLIK